MRKYKELHRLEFRHYDDYQGGGCRVYENGDIVRGASAGGCGYDRQGSAFANWIELQADYMAKIQHLSSTKNYGLFYSRNGKRYKRHVKDCKVILDGACGFDCMRSILKKIGVTVTWCNNTRNSSFYIVQ